MYNIFIKQLRWIMSVSSSANIIKKRIMNSPDGSVFTTVDLADVIENSRVGVILSRLEEDGLIRRVIRGIYEKPVYNDFLKEYIAPSPSLVAEALARNFGWTIVPCGDTALNLLGLSTQVPAAWSYVSDGTYKEYTYDSTTIKFKRTTNKEISKLSYKTALVVQALKALGKDNINDVVISKLKNDLTDEEKENMLTEAKAATSWVYEYIKQICRSERE